jgi:Fic family protein
MNATNDIQGMLQELPDVSIFTPMGPNAELFAQIEEYNAIVNKARDDNQGLSPETIKNIERQFFVDRVRHSATIEGSTLDRRETLHVLATGHIIEGKRRPSEEIRNLGAALEMVADLVGADVVREIDLRTIHAKLLEGLDVCAGQYRPHNVSISNAKYRPPEHFDVPRLMHQLVTKMQSPPSGTSGFTLGVYAHWALARIHPFVDGNGRMARIVQDLIFLRHRLVPAPVPYQEMDDYYDSLEQADEGKTAPFLELIAQATLETLRKYRAAIEEIKQTDDWLGHLISHASASIRDTEHSIFTRHTQKMAEIRDTFQSIAERISELLPEFTCQLKQHGGIDFNQFREIKNTGRSQRTWDFGLSFALGDRRVRFIFWYGRYWPHPGDTERLLDRNPVLLASIEEAGTYRTLDDTQEEKISLRAIAIRSGEFVRIRYHPVDDLYEFDSLISASQICRDFITEVVRGKFGLG